MEGEREGGTEEAGPEMEGGTRERQGGREEEKGRGDPSIGRPRFRSDDPRVYPSVPCCPTVGTVGCGRVRV